MRKKTGFTLLVLGIVFTIGSGSLSANTAPLSPSTPAPAPLAVQPVPAAVIANLPPEEMIQSAGGQTLGPAATLINLNLPYPQFYWYRVYQDRYSSGHSQYGMIAWDFSLAQGDWIVAARDGRVSRLVNGFADDDCGSTSYYWNRSNYVWVDGGDGTYDEYRHLRQCGAKVQNGQYVVRGQPIGFSGHTGYSVPRCTDHLHFQVRGSTSGKQIRFIDPSVLQQNSDGTPRVGRSYQSGNNSRRTGWGQEWYSLLTVSTWPGSWHNYYFYNDRPRWVDITMDRYNSNLDPFLILYGPRSDYIAHNDDYPGRGLNSRIFRYLSEVGFYRVIAWSYCRSWQNWCSTGAYRLRVGAPYGQLATLAPGQVASNDESDGSWLAYGESEEGSIDSQDDRDTYFFSAIPGRSVNIRITKPATSTLDSVLELWNPNDVKLYANDDGGGNGDPWLVYTLPTDGVYRVVVRSYNSASTGAYTIGLSILNGSNYALSRTATASSQALSELEPQMATDGDAETLWTSLASNPAWLYVDLGLQRTINQVVLKWGLEYATEYGMYVQRNADAPTTWRQVYHTTSGDGGIDTVTFPLTTARRVMIQATQGALPSGYSLHEIEVYNTDETVLPSVLPDPPGKPGETVSDALPLPPAESGKDIVLVGEGSAGQETAPASVTTTLPVDVDSSIVFLLPTASISQVSPLTVTWYQDVITFTGNAFDNDESGASIIAYEWSSDIQGQFGDQAQFTLPAESLVEGEHIISFRARDDEGIWSAPVTTTLNVIPRYPIFLPLVLRNADAQ